MSNNIANARKEIRSYLRGYRFCLSKANSIEGMLRNGVVADCVRGELVRVKDKAAEQCANVQIIIRCVGGIEYEVLNAHYILGKKPKLIAREMRYSVGYIANVEAAAIKKLAEIKEVLSIIHATKDD